MPISYNLEQKILDSLQVHRLNDYGIFLPHDLMLFELFVQACQIHNNLLRSISFIYETNKTNPTPHHSQRKDNGIYAEYIITDISGISVLVT